MLISKKTLLVAAIGISVVGPQVRLGAIDELQKGQLPIERRNQLEQQLENSAFRKGVSAGIQGVIKIAPSDHSPIAVKFDGVSIASWNLLSDEHTWNFLFNVAEKKYFADYKRGGKAIFWRDIFNDFGNFVLNNSAIDASGNHKIKITAALMKDFITYEATIKRSENTIKDAEEFVNLVLDSTNPSHEDIKTSLVHIIEIKFAIAKGYLQWQERLKEINKNKFLVKSLAAHDFLCFQECTSPQDMLILLQKNAQNQDFAMLYHAVRSNSEDHCVIIYDKNKYELGEYRNFGLALNKKPCIVAQFRSLETNTSIIIGSIHHPGTGKSEMSLIIEQVNVLLQGAGDIPVMVLGDYNHQSIFYKADIVGTNFELKMPSSPTMAGFEYGNLNQAIDGVLTNRPSETTVDVLNQKTFASQIELPIEIKFEI